MHMKEIVKPRVFISCTAQDKDSARLLARKLRIFKHEVLYNEWEIAVGDSIVEKVFDGLKASDTLILVLSPSSVQSRCVREELNVAVMRRIPENDIRILPVMVATCEVPPSLKHLRYADFRDDPEDGLASLLDSLTPGYRRGGRLLIFTTTSAFSKAIARELVKTVREKVTIDWTIRENVRAQLRVVVKRILRKHGYPPDKQEKATQTVLEQAEVLSEGWAVS